MSVFNQKAKANQDDHIDRISDLPCNVIDDILGHLKIEDLVRTSVLSKKWRNMWTSAPRLWFDENFIEKFKHFDDPSLGVSKSITDVLMHHNGPVHKFTLFQKYIYKIAIESIEMWIEFLSMRNIKHLELVNFSGIGQISIAIFSCCKELTYFRFDGFDLSIPPNFCGFERLLELSLEEVTFDSSALESLISGCPLLEKLSIIFCKGFEYVDFSAPSLKVLNLVFNEDVKSICLKKAHNLIDLELSIENGKVSGLIKSLPKIQRFLMQSWYSHKTHKILYADIIPPTLLKSSFSTLEYLKLDDVNLNERGELLYIVSVLKSAPSLLELHLEDVTFDSSALGSLISGCPLLEKLSILCCTGFEYVDFSAPSLKVLNLEFYKDVKSICLKKAHNLIDLELSTENGRVSGLIKSLPKIKRFSMQSWNSHETNKTLYADMIPPTLLKSSFSTLEYLNLDDVNLNERGELLYIVSVLKSAPSLVELVVKSYNDGDITQATGHSEELECNGCCLDQLQKVNIYTEGSSHQHAMSLIRFILANSTSLKTLTFKVDLGSKESNTRKLLTISKELLLMERASQRSQIKFLHSECIGF